MPEPRKLVFVSHSAKDDAVGRRVVAALETQGIDCWYSSRPADLEPGVYWDTNIGLALDKSGAVVCMLSASANQSKWVWREIAMASDRDLPIFPLRVESVKPTGGLEPYLVRTQFVDALSEPIEEHLAPLIRRLHRLLEIESSSRNVPATAGLDRPTEAPRAGDAKPNLGKPIAGRTFIVAAPLIAGLALVLALVVVPRDEAPRIVETRTAAPPAPGVVETRTTPSPALQLKISSARLRTVDGDVYLDLVVDKVGIGELTDCYVRRAGLAYDRDLNLEPFTFSSDRTELRLSVRSDVSGTFNVRFACKGVVSNSVAAS